MKNCKSDCCINQAMELFGDRWTLLIVRDIMFGGKRSFRDLLGSDEKIASNILSARLRKLERFGIIIKTNDIRHKQRALYILSKKGIDLMPILVEIGYWSVNHLPANAKDKLHISSLMAGGRRLMSSMKLQLAHEYNNWLAKVGKKGA